MTSRAIENDRDRKMTIMTTTFIPCGAKNPVYHLPTAGNVFGSTWERSWSFIKKTGMIIRSIIKDKKAGKSLQCGQNCSNCSGHCHGKS